MVFPNISTYLAFYRIVWCIFGMISDHYKAKPLIKLCYGGLFTIKEFVK